MQGRPKNFQTEQKEKEMTRNKKIMIVFLVVCLWALSAPVMAKEQYPTRPIDFICTWGVGGGGDRISRTMGRLSEKILNVAIPVSNIPGASGNTGLANLMAAKADGYTVALFIADTMNTIAGGTSRFKISDFAYIIRVSVADSFLFVKEDSPFKTIQDLLEYAKKNPGKLKVASTGFGTGDDITVRYLGMKGYKMTTVPIPKPGQRYASTLGGHSEVLYEQAGDIKQYLEAKQLRPLIIFSSKRHPAFPNVPTSVELGFDITLPQFRTIVARAGTPAERVKKLAATFKEAMETPEWKKFAESLYFAPDSYMGAEELGPWIRSEAETMKKFMKTFGMVK
jgi:tripartite-type tricarboxylate transporter receptor subunit TctC